MKLEKLEELNYFYFMEQGDFHSIIKNKLNEQGFDYQKGLGIVC